MGEDNQPDGMTHSAAIMASKKEEKMRQGEARFSKLFSIVIRLWYWLKLFTEGQGFKDKLILLPGTVFRLLGFATGSSKIPFLHAFFRHISKPAFNVMIENRDGKFFCRKGTVDAQFTAEAYEQPFRRYFKEITQGVFVDVGSNIGKYTVKVAGQLGNNGRVISVEPESSNFEVLKANVELNNLSNVTLLNAACWNKNEKLKLYLAPHLDLTGDHSVKNPVSTDFVEVSGLKLDDILKDLQIEHVDFIKIDAEGADGEVLEGAEETIARNPHLKIVFEATNRGNLAKCQEVLGRHGFTIAPIVKDKYYARKMPEGMSRV